MTTTEFLDNIYCNEEFNKLKGIGGCRKYHNEGNALMHTTGVIAEARKRFGKDNLLMTKVASLHDVGKIYTGIKKADGDWEYPDHALCGSFRGILSKFIPETDEDFKVIQWFIRNHIKPLFWMGKDAFVEISKLNKDKPRDEDGNPLANCRIEWLLGLVICDIKGSSSEDPQTELLNYLEALIANINWDVIQ